MGDLLGYVTSGMNFGVLGLGVWMFFTGRLHSDAEFSRMQADRDTERIAHERTREALRLSDTRADSAAVAAQVVATAFGAGHVLNPGGNSVVLPQE